MNVLIKTLALAAAGAASLGVTIAAAPASACDVMSATDITCPGANVNPANPTSLLNPANPLSPLSPSNPSNPASPLNPSNPASPLYQH